MNSRVLLLTLLFCIGFSFQQCTRQDDCGCPKQVPPGRKFDVEGAIYRHFDNHFDSLPENTSTTFENYGYINIEFEKTYIAYQWRKPTYNLSLFSNAMACSCPEGRPEAKSEKFSNITVITLNDFDAVHLANDTLNDLLSIQDDYHMESIPLNDYLQQEQKLIGPNPYKLFLTKAPEINKTLAVRVIVELSNSELYGRDVYPITFTN